MQHDRRRFLKAGSFSLAAASFVLSVPAFAEPTPSLDDGASPPLDDLPAATPATALGPFYREKAPFRAKVTPPLEPGVPLVIQGRVFSFEQKRPLADARLDIWQVGLDGKYSNGDGDFKNRARVVVDEEGRYELETIHPVGYWPSPTFWRSAHVHFRVTAPGHRVLATEIFFEGDPDHEKDAIFDARLLRPVEVLDVSGARVERVAFDIAL